MSLADGFIEFGVFIVVGLPFALALSKGSKREMEEKKKLSREDKER
jgi:hypothetical protein